MALTKLKRLQNNYLAHKEKNPNKTEGCLGTSSSGPSDVPITLTAAMRSRTTDTHKTPFEQGKTRPRSWVLERFLAVTVRRGPGLLGSPRRWGLTSGLRFRAGCRWGAPNSLRHPLSPWLRLWSDRSALRGLRALSVPLHRGRLVAGSAPVARPQPRRPPRRSPGARRCR